MRSGFFFGDVGLSSVVSYSIVINTFERPESLSRCLEALSRQKGIAETEIIAVDDGSDGDFSAIERNWKKKIPLRYLKIRHAGRAAARNRGVKAASGSRVIFLGDDILVRPGWLEAHVESGREERLRAVIGPCPLQAPPAKEAGKPSKALLLAYEPIPFDEIKNPEDAGFRFFISGNLSMDRALFLELGGFDERFQRYGWEDIELGYRFARVGGRVIYDEKAKAVHAHPATGAEELWAREFSTGITAYQFWSKYKAPDLAFLKWWDENSPPSPAWKRRLGHVAIAALERLAPNAAMLPGLYRRLAYAYRRQGFLEGERLYGTTMTEPGIKPAT